MDESSEGYPQSSDVMSFIDLEYNYKIDSALYCPYVSGRCCESCGIDVDFWFEEPKIQFENKTYSALFAHVSI